MKTLRRKLRLLPILLVSFLINACTDNVPDIETLPSAAVDFTYKVIDDSYQLDYYTGANIEFNSISAEKGTCVWDFGDGTASITGESATHKYQTAGTYNVKLTIADKFHRIYPIMVRDIKPIMSVDSIQGGICEVRNTSVSISMELPNPEKLSEEYLWIFPSGTTDENGNLIQSSDKKNPGKLKFGNVGSQTVRLSVKLGGRQLEEGTVNVQVGYNQEVPTLYYAVKGGNIMAIKLAKNAPEDMMITPFDMGISSGNHALNVLFNDASLYILDCGKQFTYVDDKDSNLGDGRIQVMAKDGSKVETLLTNKGQAFDDPYFGFIEGSNLYFTNRNTGIMRVGLTERNRVFTPAEFPYFVQNATLGYYNNGWSYGSLSANFAKIDNTWFWCKTYNGTGIFRFAESDILKAATTGGVAAPAAGVTLSGMSPKSIVWDAKNKVIYFTIYDTGYEGLYRCTLEQLTEIGATRSKLAPYLLKTANGKSVIPITETGKGEGSTGEFIGISQLTIDEATDDVYFGLRSGDTTMKSGLMRYNATKKHIEYVIEGVEVYGVSINKSKSKLF